ncbi:MAG: hypothetical protein WD691_10970 [Acidimicrobiales bacterium]
MHIGGDLKILTADLTSLGTHLGYLLRGADGRWTGALVLPTTPDLSVPDDLIVELEGEARLDQESALLHLSVMASTSGNSGFTLALVTDQPGTP